MIKENENIDELKYSLSLDDRSGLISEDSLPECTDEFKNRISQEIDELLENGKD